MTNIDKGLERIEKGEAWHDTDEVVQVEIKKPLDKVIPVRLSADDWAKLREEAREVGVGPTTLVRMWILERLRLQNIFQDTAKHRKFRTESTSLAGSWSLLTPREKVILNFTAHGYLPEQIAEVLGISMQTVTSHLESIIRKAKAGQEHPSYKEVEQGKV